MEEQKVPVTVKEKWEAIKETGKKLDKQFSGTTFQKLGQKVGQQVPSIQTNLPSIDWHVFGCGGVPRGRIIEVYGPESSGKTALCSHLIGQCQKAGGIAAFVDAEHALDPTFASKLGVNVDELLVSQPDYGEQALEIVEALVESRAVDLIVVDSVSALTPRAELDGEMGDVFMGLQARMMSQAMRKLVGVVAKSGTTVVFINQVRDKIGLVFGNPMTTSGGKALRFAASVRLEVNREAASKGGVIKEDEVAIGHRMRVKAQKNKVGAPFREAIVDLYYDTGFDTEEDTIVHAQRIGVVNGTAWLTINGDKEKYRREDLPLDKVAEAVAKYYKELAVQSVLEATNEE
jgi:recombination protein RecA